jgi:hypothetical protein
MWKKGEKSQKEKPNRERQAVKTSTITGLKSMQDQD